MKYASYKEIVDKMVEFIAKRDIDEDICKKVKKCYDDDEDALDCTACIIDFFAGYNNAVVVDDSVKIGAKIACEGISADLSKIWDEE